MFSLGDSWAADHLHCSGGRPTPAHVWSGPAQGITAIHVWEFTPTDHGVLVHTEESWDGEVVRAQTATLQQALDGSLRAWLTNLKHAAEQAGR